MAWGGEAAVPAIHRLHLLAVVVVADFVDQRRDPLGIELEGRHLLPEALAALPVAAPDLCLDQLTGEQEHQLLFLAGQRIQLGVRAACAAAPALIPVCPVHGCRSRWVASALGPVQRPRLQPLQETYRWPRFASDAVPPRPAAPAALTPFRHSAP